MKWIDPAIETIACASSSPFLAHYPEWDRKVLEQCYDTVDYISLHHYHSAPPDIPEALLAGYQAYEKYIDTEIALCDYLKTKLRTNKTMYLALDEYASMYRPRGEAHLGKNGVQTADMFFAFDPQRKYVRHDPDDWSTRRMPPRGNEMLFALANASTMLVMLRRADRIKIGCATGGINMLCQTDREHVWKGAAYYPFSDMIHLAKGVSLRCEGMCDTYDVPGYAIDDMNQYGGFTGVKTVQAAAAMDEETGELNIFVINADLNEEQELKIDLRAFEKWQLQEHTEMFAQNEKDASSFEHPDVLVPRKNGNTRIEGGILTAVLRKASWNVFRLSSENGKTDR